MSRTMTPNPSPSPATAALAAAAAAAAAATGGDDVNFEAPPETETTATNPPPPGPGPGPSYYAQGSTEIAIETPVLQQRLERRRRLTVTAGGGGGRHRAGRHRSSHNNSSKDAAVFAAGDRLLIVLVGLPARGKSYIGRKLQNYLNWRGNQCKIFNVGKYRRQVGSGSGDGDPTSPSTVTTATKQDASFFDDSNREAARLRQQAAGLALDETLKWLHGMDDATEGEDDEGMKNSTSSTSLASSSSSTVVSTSSSTAGGDDGSSSSSSSSQDPSLMSKRLSYSARRQYHRVAIFDATNSTQERRKWILEKCASFNSSSSNTTDDNNNNNNKTDDAAQQKSKDTTAAAAAAAVAAGDSQSAVGVLFLESLCDDQALLEENYLVKIATCPDFDGMDRQDALNDLKSRIERYESRYETISEDDPSSYIKIYNLGSRLAVNHVYGRLAKVVLPAIMAWNTGSRPIYLVRSGETTSMEQYMRRLKTTATTTAASQQQQQQAGSGNGHSQNRPTTYRRNKSDRLGDRGNRFRQALCNFIEKEGMDFMKRQTSSASSDSAVDEHNEQNDDLDASFGLHHPCQMDTGTSISGLYEERDHRPFEDNSYSKTNVRRSKNGRPITTNDVSNVTSSSEVETLKDEASASDEDDESKHDAACPFPCLVMSSTMPRAIETASWDKHPFPVKDVTNLNPLDMGDLSGLDLATIRAEHPVWYNRLEQNPYNTRFPGGESYGDMIDRLWPVIIDLEQTLGPAVIVSHVSVLQVLLSYFRSTPVSQSIQVEVPMHTVFKFVPLRGGGWLESRHVLLPDEDAAEPLRQPRPSSSSSNLSGSHLTTICSSSQLYPAAGLAGDTEGVGESGTERQQQQQIQDEEGKGVIWGDSRSCMPHKLE